MYEDAIESNEVYLNHSVISPLLNSGLLTPDYVVNRVLEFSKNNKIPLNSLEGFLRQIIGWREFIRGMYISRGTYSRNLNFWKFDKQIPKVFIMELQVFSQWMIQFLKLTIHRIVTILSD